MQTPTKEAELKLLALPSEILFAILSHIPIPHLLHLSLVNTHFRKLTTAELTHRVHHTAHLLTTACLTDALRVRFYQPVDRFSYPHHAGLYASCVQGIHLRHADDEDGHGDGGKVCGSKPPFWSHYTQCPLAVPELMAGDEGKAELLVRPVVQLDEDEPFVQFFTHALLYRPATTTATTTTSSDSTSSTSGSASSRNRRRGLFVVDQVVRVFKPWLADVAASPEEERVLWIGRKGKGDGTRDVGLVIGVKTFPTWGMREDQRRWRLELKELLVRTVYLRRVLENAETHGIEMFG